MIPSQACHACGATRPTPRESMVGWCHRVSGEVYCHGCATFAELLDMAATPVGKRPPVALYGTYAEVRPEHVSTFTGDGPALPIVEWGRRFTVVTDGHMHGWKQYLRFRGPAGSVFGGWYYDTAASGNLLRGVKRVA